MLWVLGGLATLLLPGPLNWWLQMPCHLWLWHPTAPVALNHAHTLGRIFAKPAASQRCPQVWKYELHARFGHLCAPSIRARLQLAALYAGAGSLLPEPGSQLTGAQTAMRLVRQSWGVRPLSQGALQQLGDAARLDGHLAAGLRLLAHELRASASQLNSLHFPDGAPEHAAPPSASPELADWLQAYQCEREALGSSNPWLLLTAGEEQRSLGLLREVPQPPPWKRLRLCQPLDVPPCPVGAELVLGIEAALRQLVLPGAAVKAEGYPLLAGGSAQRSTPLERDMHAELEGSWNTHHSLPAPVGVRADAADVIRQAQVRMGGETR